MSDNHCEQQGIDAKADPQLETADDGELSVVAVLRQLKDGTLKGKQLSACDRRRCVRYLLAEACTTADIVTLLGVCERTVHRDKVAVRKESALKVDPEFAGEMAGHLVSRAEAITSHLMRLGKDPSATVQARIESYRAAWHVQDKLVERLQTLGFLPTAATRVQADLVHRVAPEADNDLDKEIDRVREMLSAGGDAATPELAALALQLERLAAAEAAAKVVATVDPLPARWNTDLDIQSPNALPQGHPQ